MNSENNLGALSNSIDLENPPLETPGEPDPRDRKTYYTRVTPARKVLVPIAVGVFRMLASVEVSGAENMPRRGPVVLAANHLTNFDVFPIQFSCARPIFFMGKAELYTPAGVDWVLRQLGSFPVERGAHDEWAMRQAERVLYAEQVLGMFPEGKRNRGQGLRPAKTGIARLALAADCPIVPVGLHGTQYILSRLSRRTQVTVKLGEPIYPEKGDTPLSLTDRAMFALADLLPPESRGAYRYHPGGF